MHDTSVTSRFSGQPSDRCGQLIVRRVNASSVFLKLANGIVSLQQAVFVTYYCSAGHSL